MLSSGHTPKCILLVAAAAALDLAAYSTAACARAMVAKAIPHKHGRITRQVSVASCLLSGNKRSYRFKM